MRALGIEPSVVHLNEGHAAFSALDGAGDTLEDIVAAARERTVFTTHTPVPAGNDAYPGAVVAELLEPLLAQRGFATEDVLRLGRTHPDDENEPFGITQLALRTARATNGVSRRHGEVAREMWVDVWPGSEVAEVPIGHVTNGVHVPTWLGRPMRALLDRHLEPGWIERAADPATWEGVDAIGDDELRAVRREQREALIAMIRERVPRDRLVRGEERGFVEAGAQAFEPDVLTLGFARRVATYKRLGLLVHDVERALKLLEGTDCPVQLVVAGKAHPKDDPGKQLIQHLLHLRGAPGTETRVVFLSDYDLAIAAKLVQGCDVWVNVPRPPMEASGTSGMKAAINGVPHLSIADGWWAEGYNGANGWVIDGGAATDDYETVDAADANALYRLLEEEVVPAFYERDAAHIPRRWLGTVKEAIRSVAPRFCARRMVKEYVTTMYAPAMERRTVARER
jgi:starch phosphorylase